MPSKTNNRLITFENTARRLALTQTELCRLIVRGTLPRPVQLAGGLKFFESDVDGLLSRLRDRYVIVLGRS